MENHEKILLWLVVAGIVGAFGALALFAYRFEVGIECVAAFLMLIVLCLFTLKKIIAGGRRDQQLSSPRTWFLGGF